jgi:uncharacterized membrane protein YedE/YeeE
MRRALAVLAFGAGFGFLLGWARLADPDVIHAMLRLDELDVYLLMGSAIGVATIGVRVLKARRARAWVDGAPITWTTLPPQRHHVVGSVLFGLGWSLSNACPGPIAVQLGRGEWSAIFTTLGFMGGIALRDAVVTRASATSVAAPRRPAALVPAVEVAMSGEAGS